MQDYRLRNDFPNFTFPEYILSSLCRDIVWSEHHIEISIYHLFWHENSMCSECVIKRLVDNVICFLHRFKSAIISWFFQAIIHESSTKVYFLTLFFESEEKIIRLTNFCNETISIVINLLFRLPSRSKYNIRIIHATNFPESGIGYSVCKSMNTATMSSIWKCMSDNAFDKKSGNMSKSSHKNHISCSNGRPNIFNIQSGEIISSLPEWDLRKPIGNIGSKTFVPWISWREILDRKRRIEIHDRVMTVGIYWFLKIAHILLRRVHLLFWSRSSRYHLVMVG